jgi:hypothetical protein
MKLALILAATVLLAASPGAASGGQPRLPPMPADAPAADEAPLEAPGDPVVLKCVKFAEMMDKQTGTGRLKVVVTRSRRWGTVWRADSAFPGEAGGPPSLWRTVCWKSGVLERPLDMFDTRQNIPPL